MPRRPSEDEIRRIYRDTIDKLFGFVLRRCNGDRELAEDITQETWLRAVRDWRARGLPDRPLAWLTTVAARLASNHHRRNTTEPLDETLSARLTAPDDSAERDRMGRQSLVRRALARLPGFQLSLIEAFHYDRRSVADIARTYELTERGVEGRLRRARHKLRQILESDPETREYEP